MRWKNKIINDHEIINGNKNFVSERYIWIINSGLILYLNFQISAQESRRKKKEFVDTLEQRVSLASAEVDAYKKRCDLLQKQNASLITQLNNLRAMLVNQQSASPSSTLSGTTASNNIISSSKTISSNTLSASKNGIKTEPTMISTHSIKIEPDCT